MKWLGALLGRNTAGPLPSTLAATYRSQKHGISFKHPSDWGVEAEDTMEGFNTLVVRLCRRTDIGLTGVSVVVMAPVTRDDDIEGFLKSSKSQFANAFAGFRPHSYRRYQFHGHSGAWMEHSYDGDGGRVREAIVAAFIDQRHFCLPLQFILESPEPKFSTDLKTFNALLESVTVDLDGLKGNIDIKIIG